VLRYEILTPRTRVNPDSIDVEGTAVHARSSLGNIDDEIGVGEGGALEILRHWTISSRASFRLPCAALLDGDFSRWIVPAVMYDGNIEGTGRFPRGGLEIGWSFREDRCPIPSCSVVMDGSGRGWAFFTEPAGSEEEISSIRSTRRNGGVVLEIATPFEEGPFTYREKGWPVGGQGKPTGKWFPPASGLRYHRRFTLLPINGPRVPYLQLFASARRRCMRGDPALWARVDWGRYIALKTHWLRTHALYKKKGVTGIIRHRRMPPIIQRFFCDFVGGSFLSKGMEAAVCFYRLGKECGEERLRGLAFEIADFLLRGELPSGLAFDEYSIHGRQFGGFFMPGRGLSGVASSRCMGESAEQYVRLRESGAEDPRWALHARRIADFFLTHQLPDGNYGRFWSPEGKLLDARGTNGAYIIWLMAALARLTGDRAYLDSGNRAARYFIETVTKPQRYTFDTLDAECVDKEAGHALLRAFLLLHRQSGDDALLEAARDAAGFCLGWQFAWDVPFSPSTPLGRLHFHTFGGTSVSVAHHHLDPYGLVIALDFLRLARVLSETCWEDFAHDLMGFCGQLVSTPERPLDRGADFIGYQPEQYNHTDWSYIHHLLGGKGSYSSPASWVASATLGAVLDIREEFPAHLPGAARLDLSELGNARGFQFP
jgi:hypothetical protein